MLDRELGRHFIMPKKKPHSLIINTAVLKGTAVFYVRQKTTISFYLCQYTPIVCQKVRLIKADTYLCAAIRKSLLIHGARAPPVNLFLKNKLTEVQNV